MSPKCPRSGPIQSSQSIPFAAFLPKCVSNQPSGQVACQWSPLVSKIRHLTGSIGGDNGPLSGGLQGRGDTENEKDVAGGLLTVHKSPLSCRTKERTLGVVAVARPCPSIDCHWTAPPFFLCCVVCHILSSALSINVQSTTCIFGNFRIRSGSEQHHPHDTLLIHSKK